MESKFLQLMIVIILQLISTEAMSCTHLRWPQKPFCETYPFHWAATSGDVEYIKSLLENGTDMDLKTGGGEDTAYKNINYRGNTPLHIGARYGRADVVQLLLRHGADETIRNDVGEKPGNRARIKFCNRDFTSKWCALAESDYTTTITILKDGCSKIGCITGHVCINRRCVKPKYPIYIQAACGPQVWPWWSISRCQNYPFHWAAVTGDEAEVAIYLQQGTEVDLKDGEQYTPLMLAAWAGRAGTVSLLLDHGADDYRTNFKGITASILASQGFCSNPNSSGCNLGEVDYNKTLSILQEGKITAMTQTMTPCVRFKYWNNWYEATSCACCWNSNYWCATSTSPEGHIKNWDYCNSKTG